MSQARSAFSEPPKTLLLPVSFGLSSLVMLQILDEYYHIQLKRKGRKSFEVHVLLVKQSPTGHAYETATDRLKNHFPSHTFSTVSIEDIFNYDANLQIEPGIAECPQYRSCNNNNVRFHRLMSSLPSASSESDILGILKLRLIAAFAKQHGCAMVLYGDSATRLAEKTLCETAKGRGSSLLWMTADGLPLYGVKTNYVMRDLLKKEILSYADLLSPSLAPFVISETLNQTNVLLKDTTISDLMSQYFESVEKNYPSVVANVVRTSSKLIMPLSSSSSACSICHLLMPLESYQWEDDRPSSDAPENGAVVEGAGAVCYGCARSVRGLKEATSAT